MEYHPVLMTIQYNYGQDTLLGTILLFGMFCGELGSNTSTTLMGFDKVTCLFHSSCVDINNYAYSFRPLSESGGNIWRI